MKKNIYTVSQINTYIGNLLGSDGFLKGIWLKGEVSNRSKGPGHLYFTLKDESCEIPCVMWRSDRIRGLNFDLENGQSILARGDITVYKVRGRYQFQVVRIELFGRGELYIRLEQFKRELAQKGYFDPDRKKPLPKYPRTVGIVTASTGAAIRDITSIAARRNPYVQLYLYPAKVQGVGAAQTVAAGIRYLDRFGVDVIIIGRGGGSFEDLWAFNEPEVAEAIYQARTPIVSGTGHEVDFTIADYCADVRAATPSAACEIVIPDLETIRREMDNMLALMDGSMERKLTQLARQLEVYAGQLEAYRPEHKLKAWILRFSHLSDNLNARMEDKLKSKKQIYDLYLQKLSILSPTSRLQGGYSFAQTEDGKPIYSVKDLQEGMVFELVFQDGQARVETKSVKEGSLETDKSNG